MAQGGRGHRGCDRRRAARVPRRQDGRPIPLPTPVSLFPVRDVLPSLSQMVRCVAGLPCVAISNFSWDFIYSEYLLHHGAKHSAIVQQIADDYAQADLLLRLPGFVPMPAFPEVHFMHVCMLSVFTPLPTGVRGQVQDVPWVVRTAVKSREQVLQELGIPLESKVKTPATEA